MASEQNSSWLHRDVEALLERFEQAWQPAFDANAVPPMILAFSVQALQLSGNEAQKEALAELVKIDLEYRWRLWNKRGGFGQETKLSISDQSATDFPETPHVEDYLRRIPELSNSVDLALEEFRVRHKYGDRPTKDEFLSRFSSMAEELSEKLQLALAESSGIERDAGPLSDADSGDPAPSKPVAVEKERVASASTSEDASDSLAIPEKIGRYAVESVLGEGAFGAVYLARDPDLDRQVAIKVPHTDRLSDEESVELFMREARMAAQLRHPSAVRVFDIERQDKLCFIVMEYIEGSTLRTLSRQRSMTLTEIARTISAVGDALHEAHKLGLVHRDLKPGNILIDKQGDPRVADFGLAVLETDQRSRAGEVSGTPAYMSPEQVRGETHRLDGRCDIWAMGVILYELLTGRKPFDGSSVYEVFDEIKHREPKPPRQIDDTIPVSLERIVQGCLAKNVAERYSTARDVAEDLRRSIETSLARMEASNAASAAHSTSGDQVGPIRWRGESTSQSSGGRTFPRASGRLIGRDAEQEQLKSWLTDDGVSLVTLTGAAGIGKSRLAQELGLALMPRLPGGCWWCDLSNTTTAEAIAHAVLTAFEIPPQDEGDATDMVGAILELRRPLLLVFDQADLAISALVSCLEAWTRVAPRMTCLTTARTALGSEGEQQFELDNLTTPGLDKCATLEREEIESLASVQLFVDRAQQVDRHFQLNDATASDVALICSHLEGIPLALELAAARVKVLKPAQMLKKIDRKFQLLSSTRKDIPARQRTLAGAIDLSYEQLSDWEQAAFEQACVFSSGFFLDAAEAVIDLDDFPAAPLAMDVVQSLREKSLLRVRDEQHELRFDMFRSIREYGTNRRNSKQQHEQERELRRRFAEYMVDYAEQWSERIPGADGPEALDRVMLERENLLAAEDWAVSAGEHDLAARAILALHAAVKMRGGLTEWVARLQLPLDGVSIESRIALLTAISEAQRSDGAWDLALQAAEQATKIAEDVTHCPASAAAFLQLAEMRRGRGEVALAVAAYDHAIQISRDLDEQHLLARTIASRGFTLWQQGEFDDALAAYDEAGQIARAEGEDALLAGISRQRGHVFMARGDFAVADKCFLEAETIARRRGDKRTLHLATSSRGMALAEAGNYDEAIRCYNEAERTTRQLGEKRGVATNQGNRGLALADRGDYEEAQTCFDRAEALNRELGNRSGVAINLGNRGAVLAALGRLEEAQTAIEAAIKIHHELGNRAQIAMCRGDLGTVLEMQGDHAKASSALQEALETLEGLNALRKPDGFLYMAAHARALAAAGQRNVAEEQASAAKALATELGIDETTPRIRVREAFKQLREQFV
ncbi:MAG: protein kinase [Pirellulales bacterium]|nr:protein kinase [Pirellulales bacterium]